MKTLIAIIVSLNFVYWNCNSFNPQKNRTVETGEDSIKKQKSIALGEIRDKYYSLKKQKLNINDSIVGEGVFNFITKEINKLNADIITVCYLNNDSIKQIVSSATRFKLEYTSYILDDFEFIYPKSYVINGNGFKKEFINGMIFRHLNSSTFVFAGNTPIGKGDKRGFSCIMLLDSNLYPTRQIILNYQDYPNYISYSTKLNYNKRNYDSDSVFVKNKINLSYIDVNTSVDSIIDYLNGGYFARTRIKAHYNISQYGLMPLWTFSGDIGYFPVQ